MANEFEFLADAIGDIPRHWWLIALRGIAAIIFGALAFIWPGVTLAVLVLFFGAYAIVDGGIALYSAFRTRGQHFWATLLEGLVGTGAGLVTFFWPAITALVLLFVIATWAILTGALEVFAAIRLRRVIRNEWALIFSGALSIVFGVLLIAQPGAGALAVVWLIGLYAVIFGVALLVLALRLRGLAEAMPNVGARAARPKPV